MDRSPSQIVLGNNTCEFSSRLMRGLHKSTAWFDLLSLQRAARGLGVDDRVSVAGWVSYRSGADLSRPAARHSEPAADRRAHRSGAAGRDSYRDRRSDRPCGARVLRPPRPAVHHELHNALSRIYLRPRADPGEPDLRGVAAFSRRRHRNHGGNAVADERTARSADFPISACGRVASTPNCSGPIAPSTPAFHGRYSSCLGRVAVEKNLDAFLSLDLPGTKVVIGKGPMEAELKRRFPQAKFLGQLENGTLAAHLAAADVFVFPS